MYEVLIVFCIERPSKEGTDIIYLWKCPAINCTAEYIGEINRSLKESFRP